MNSNRLFFKGMRADFRREAAWITMYALLFLFLINRFGFEGLNILLLGFEIPVQTFAIGAMIPIALYNGEKGWGGKAMQYAAYWFYPAHMLILGLIGRFL